MASPAYNNAVMAAQVAPGVAARRGADDAGVKSA